MCFFFRVIEEFSAIFIVSWFYKVTGGNESLRVPRAARAIGPGIHSVPNAVAERSKCDRAKPTAGSYSKHAATAERNEFRRSRMFMFSAWFYAAYLIEKFVFIFVRVEALAFILPGVDI